MLLGISRNYTCQESDWILVYKIWLSSLNCSRNSRVFFLFRAKKLPAKLKNCRLLSAMF